MNHSKARILFLGTPKISADILEFLINEGFNIIGAISQIDRETDRKGNLLPTEVKKVCLKYNIPIYQYDRIKNNIEDIKNMNPDVILTLAYGQLIPKSILDIPNLGSINLHGSILPKYRGAAPIQRAIMDGEKITGFSLMKMVEKMDAGAVYAVEKIEILPEDNYSSLLLKMIECCKKLITNYLDLYLNGALEEVEQNEDLVTFANKIKKEDEVLSLNDSCHAFINRVRALSYQPGGYLFLDNTKIKILKCSLMNNSLTSKVGTIIIKDKKILLQLKDGCVSIDELQVPGKKLVSAKDYINGHKDIDGKTLKDEI